MLTTGDTVNSLTKKISSSYNNNKNNNNNNNNSSNNNNNNNNNNYHCFGTLGITKACFIIGNKACFIIRKTFGLPGLYIVVKGTISSFLVVFGCLKTSRSICLAFSMLASISDFGLFVLSILFFSSLNSFCLTFSFSTMIHILFPRENGLFVKQVNKLQM